MDITTKFNVEDKVFFLTTNHEILKMGEQVSIMELAQKILKEKRSEAGLRIIGVRPGEKLDEVLMTNDEESRARQVENFWVIPPIYLKGGEKNYAKKEKK